MMEKNMKKECIHVITESFCYRAEINMTLLVNYR